MSSDGSYWDELPKYLLWAGVDPTAANALRERLKTHVLEAFEDLHEQPEAALSVATVKDIIREHITGTGVKKKEQRS